jgi:hypothetical protein
VPAALGGGIGDPVDRAEQLTRLGRVVVGDLLVDKAVQRVSGRRIGPFVVELPVEQRGDAALLGVERDAKASVLDNRLVAFFRLDHAGQRIPADHGITERGHGGRSEQPAHAAVKVGLGVPGPKVGGLRHAPQEVAAGRRVVT